MGSHIRVEKRVLTKAAPDVFAFVLDVENYARLMPNVRSVSILEEREFSRLTRWETEIEGAPLIWIERDTIRPDALRIEFDAIEGDLKVFRGAWSVDRIDGVVNVVCQVEYQVGIAAIEELVDPVLKVKIAENLEVMLDALVRGLEA